MKKNAQPEKIEIKTELYYIFQSLSYRVHKGLEFSRVPR